jgi:hypothetical protein
MRPLAPFVVVAAVAAASPAAAQLRNRSVALESSLSAPLSSGGAGHAALALAATAWLDDALEATARVAFAAAPRTAGREPVTTASGTAGLRLSLLPDPLRPQLGVELGWARVEGTGRREDRLALGASIGLEWFPARDLSFAARAALRGAGRMLSGEMALGLAAYF